MLDMCADKARLLVQTRYERAVDRIIKGPIGLACQAGMRYVHLDCKKVELDMEAYAMGIKNPGITFKNIMEENGYTVKVTHGLYCIYW